MYKLGAIREWKLANFSVGVDALEEDDLDLSFDDEVLAKLRSGELIAFVAHAWVRDSSGALLSEDYLGGCIYESLEAFMDHRDCGRQNREYEARGESGRCGSYFTDMVRNVIREARKKANAPHPKLRAVA